MYKLTRNKYYQKYKPDTHTSREGVVRAKQWMHTGTQSYVIWVVKQNSREQIDNTVEKALVNESTQ